MTRKRAPGKPAEHPDYFISLSGGVDSTAAALTVLPAIRSLRDCGNMAKKPVSLYLDTRTGVPLNRFYVEILADWLDIQLWTLRTEEKFESWLQRDGAPGPGAHEFVRNELKNRQVSKIATLADNPYFVLGIAADESDTRAEFGKIREMERHTELLPVHRLSRKERVEIVIRSGAPINPLWIHPDVISDCGCLCNGDPSELDKTEQLFPKFASKLRRWEESISHDGVKDTLGWGGLDPSKRRAREQEQTQATLPMCGAGCSRERDPAEVRAFRAIAHDKSKSVAIAKLHGEPPKSKPTRNPHPHAGGGSR
jgi:3'-phosphoadenosine 5'-phosphosulfate sulfotransferase (PAPS reductase)/FAD synthetase